MPQAIFTIHKDADIGFWFHKREEDGNEELDPEAYEIFMNP